MKQFTGNFALKKGPLIFKIFSFFILLLPFALDREVRRFSCHNNKLTLTSLHTTKINSKAIHSMESKGASEMSAG